MSENEGISLLTDKHVGFAAASDEGFDGRGRDPDFTKMSDRSLCCAAKIRRKSFHSDPCHGIYLARVSRSSQAQSRKNLASVAVVIRYDQRADFAQKLRGEIFSHRLAFMADTQILQHGVYEHPSVQDVTGYVGYVEPSGPAPGWILFYRADGSAQLYGSRAPSGAVLGEPIELPAGAVSMPEPESGSKPPPPILPPPFQE